MSTSWSGSAPGGRAGVGDPRPRRPPAIRNTRSVRPPSRDASKPSRSRKAFRVSRVVASSSAQNGVVGVVALAGVDLADHEGGERHRQPLSDLLVAHPLQVWHVRGNGRRRGTAGAAGHPCPLPVQVPGARAGCVPRRPARRNTNVGGRRPDGTPVAANATSDQVAVLAQPDLPGSRMTVVSYPPPAHRPAVHCVGARAALEDVLADRLYRRRRSRGGPHCVRGRSRKASAEATTR
jgi:hypothetical protein